MFKNQLGFRHTLDNVTNFDGFCGDTVHTVCVSVANFHFQYCSLYVTLPGSCYSFCVFLVRHYLLFESGGSLYRSTAKIAMKTEKPDGLMTGIKWDCCKKITKGATCRMALSDRATKVAPIELKISGQLYLFI